ncbi:MAG: sigma-70 family RNA polymerase sigma factor [Tannerellaceae bacterium]|jgi:RNA polymerase sigma-70 factor (ECF subfamily)|nr:sigma-70 family RNA polymerase sigma factor [Tannerellaceae bacterium]
MEEHKWIKDVLAGDTHSFSYLVGKYQQMAFSIAFRILGNREEAEEAVQDAFVKMYRALPDFRFDSKFSTWFYTIVYRTSLTAYRKEPLFTDYNEAASAHITPEEAGNAASLLESNDRKAVISNVLKRLPPDESLLLTLYYLEECSVEEIHQITQLTLSNIKVKLFRARKRFYETLKHLMKHETYAIL